MGDDGFAVPLSRRVPGATRPSPGQVVPPVLPESVLNRMQAAIDAEHAQAEDRQGEPNTEPLPRVTESTSPSQHAANPVASPSGTLPENDDQDWSAKPGRVARPSRATRPRRAEEPLRAAKALRVAEELGPAAEAQAAEELRVAQAARVPAAGPEPPAVAEPQPVPAAAVLSPEEPAYPVPPPRAAEAPPPRRPTVAAAYDTQPTPGSIGWLWPEETATGGSGGRWRPPGRWRYRTALLVGLGGVLIAAGGLALGVWLHSTPVVAAVHGKSRPKATAPRKAVPTPTAAPSSPAAPDPAVLAGLRAAASWVNTEVAPSTQIACDPGTCAALTASGYPATQLVHLAAKSQSLSGASLIVVTPLVRTLLTTINPALGYQVAPTVLASFGPISIQPVDPDGGQAYVAELSQDVQNRIQLGTQLLNSGRVTASTSATAELEAGQVDSRLLLAIQAVSYQESVYIAGFVDSGPGASPGVPYRAAGLAETDPSGEPSTSYLQTMVSVLEAHATFPAPQGTPLTLPDGQTVLKIQYLAPSPLGLLTSN
jgi:hypothetical protein